MREKINKNKVSLLNAVTALIMTLINGLLGIIATRYIIVAFGSDFNGLNSTSNQIVNVLLILEGGFTVASNVALFGPLTRNEVLVVNGILTATRRKFRRIGSLFLALGTLVAVGYTFVVNSQLQRELIFTVIWMTVFPAAFNLLYATTYRVLLQAQQREYVISGITALTIGLGHIANIILVTHGGRMWMVRSVTMLFSLANSMLIVTYVKRHNTFISFNAEERGDLIKGTNDVMVQKITGVLYNAAPMVFLSCLPVGGTVSASIYAVYNNIFTMIKSLLHSVIDAPRLGFGQLLTERRRTEIWPVFAQYEFLAFMSVAILLTTAYVLTLPFVTLYTSDIADANYIDPVIALLMALTVSVEMLHIPSGHLINMAGLFRVSRNIQLVACAALFICMTAGGLTFGLYGMLGAILLVALLLAVMEIGYVHVFFFPKKGVSFLKLILPTVVVCLLLAEAESALFAPHIDGVSPFIVYGSVCGLTNIAAVLVVNGLFQRKLTTALFHRALALIKKSK